MVGAVSGPDAGRAGVVPRPQPRPQPRPLPRPQPRPHLQQLLLNRLQSTSSLVTTVTLVCYTLSSTASYLYLYCSKATYPGLTWLLAWVLAWVLMEMMLARLCCTATTSEFCLLLAGLSPPPTV